MPDAENSLGIIYGAQSMEHVEGIWALDSDDWLLMAMLTDPIYAAELLFADYNNHEYSGCYQVMDYQVLLFRPQGNYAGFPCGRSLGKTESIKARAVAHIFRRQGEGLLLTAPEMIHLKPLCDAVEDRIMDTRLVRDFLDTRNQKTGITHKPFKATFVDQTYIEGRIPRLSGQGMKGAHIPDMMVDESQDFPERGWIEAHETVLKDHTDSTGNYDFTYHFYGVHNGTRDGTFYRLSTSGEYQIVVRTALMRPGWNAAEKRSAAAMYGGTNSPDYRRNILGEAGSGSNAYFVTSRLMACVDQDFESKYNTQVFARQRLTAEEVDQIIPQPQGGTAEAWQEYGTALGNMLDLPHESAQQWYAGMDLGLVNDPTVITLWRVMRDSERKKRLQLVRLFELERFREKMIRYIVYKLGWHFGPALRGFGMDITGLGLPIFQAMEDDEIAPQHLLDVSEGYTFNSKVPVGIDQTFVTKDSQGNLRDQYGSIVEEVRDPYTGDVRFVVRMAMIEASTRYLRNWVDTGEMSLPFDKDIVADMQGETEQRVRAMAGMKRKPAAFHILDAMRAMAMVRVHEEVMSQVAVPNAAPVLVRAPSMESPTSAVR